MKKLNITALVFNTLMIVGEIILFINLMFINASPIIGGADGPTYILVNNTFKEYNFVILLTMFLFSLLIEAFLFLNLRKEQK
jgi:Na+-transporting methylmalonyl-CoA/oxaloacetate decarboxylase beta subunit